MKKKYLFLIPLVFFIMFTILVYNGYLSDVDDLVYSFIIKSKCDFLTLFFKSLSFLFSTIMIIIYCIYFLFRYKKGAFKICYFMLFEAFVNNLVKIIIRRQRPNILSMVLEKTYSYPSGHTMASVVFMYLITNLILEKSNMNERLIKSISFIIVILVATARIYLGVHYFSDTIGAILLGITVISLLENIKGVKEK